MGTDNSLTADSSPQLMALKYAALLVLPKLAKPCIFLFHRHFFRFSGRTHVVTHHLFAQD